jgi:sporadic carbohydrate cluster protein (TIGR04323 family)
MDAVFSLNSSAALITMNAGLVIRSRDLGRLMPENNSHCGYIISRPVRGAEVPQKVQNLVIRNYCNNQGLVLHLSATGVTIPGGAMMPNSILSELHEIGGIVVYSMYAFFDKARNAIACVRVMLNARCSLHAAMEEHELSSLADVEHWEEVIRVSR